MTSVTLTIDEYKNKLNTEFNFTASYDNDNDLNIPFDEGTIFLAPPIKSKQRKWLNKAFKEWQRGGRTIVIVTALKQNCKYFNELLINVSEQRLVTDYLIYKNYLRVTRPMITAIYKALPITPKNHLITFD